MPELVEEDDFVSELAYVIVIVIRLRNWRVVVDDMRSGEGIVGMLVGETNIGGGGGWVKDGGVSGVGDGGGGKWGLREGVGSGVWGLIWRHWSGVDGGVVGLKWGGGGGIGGDGDRG